ncbi:MAG TPA: hypothetical protein DC054_07775 [Blastocatellia bacterium]|nr:hypothetical protein [Blastocatellia bacterium]
MYNKFIGVCTLVFGLALSAFPQGTVEQSGAPHPTQEEVIAANTRRFEQLKHPTFITLRLTSRRRDSPREEASTIPSPYFVDDLVSFQLFITQSLFDELMLGNEMSPAYEYRPELYKDGASLTYTTEAQDKVEKAEHHVPTGSVFMVQLLPGREVKWTDINVDYWYGPLGPGHYQLTVRKRFAPDGDWTESNPVTFEVIPRKQPTPIPEGVKVRLVPQHAQTQPEGQPYRFGSDDYFDVVLVNESDQSIKVNVIDSYYGNRFQLFKDGKLLSYLEETAKLIELKDAKPSSVDVASDFFIKPNSTSQLEGVNLKKWYGPLTPGVYRLIDRRRFEIDGPWTKNSAELVIEIVP